MKKTLPFFIALLCVFIIITGILMGIPTFAFDGLLPLNLFAFSLLFFALARRRVVFQKLDHVKTLIGLALITLVLSIGFFIYMIIT